MSLEIQILKNLQFKYRSVSFLYDKLVLNRFSENEPIPRSEDIEHCLNRLETKGQVTSRYLSSDRPLEHGRPVFGNISGEKKELCYRITMNGIWFRYIQKYL